MRYEYSARLSRDEDGRIVVRFRDVPEALTDGADRAEALHEAADALGAALAGYVLTHADIPPPSAARRGEVAVAVPPLVATKLALYQAMREQKVSNVELARRLGVTEAVVRRLVDPDHRSRIEKVEAALSVLGKQVVVEAA
jgi:antitoxin HicB